jgi:hypothetical protein
MRNEVTAQTVSVTGYSFINFDMVRLLSIGIEAGIDAPGRFLHTPTQSVKP